MRKNDLAFHLNDTIFLLDEPKTIEQGSPWSRRFPHRNAGIVGSSGSAVVGVVIEQTGRDHAGPR